MNFRSSTFRAAGWANLAGNVRHFIDEYYERSVFQEVHLGAAQQDGQVFVVRAADTNPLLK